MPAFRDTKTIHRVAWLADRNDTFPPEPYRLEPLIPQEWQTVIPIQPPSLLYGRPEAHVLRDIVRIIPTSDDRDS